ncbi:MAG: hypothetical protein ACI4V7_11240 [Succinivibrionaceae bacterium]
MKIFLEILIFIGCFFMGLGLDFISLRGDEQYLDVSFTGNLELFAQIPNFFTMSMICFSIVIIVLFHKKVNL